MCWHLAVAVVRVGLGLAGCAMLAQQLVPRPARSNPGRRACRHGGGTESQPHSEKDSRMSAADVSCAGGTSSVHVLPFRGLLQQRAGNYINHVGQVAVEHVDACSSF